MAPAHREVVWTFQARTMLDEAVGYIAQDSLAAAPRGALSAWSKDQPRAKKC